MTEPFRPADIVVASPMTGWVWPLSDTPDPAFAQGVIGAGVALDPVLGALRAPFSGRIVTLNASGHAVVLRHACGLELLVHVGIDTVQRDGSGFDPRVQAGQQVVAGELLIRFDLDDLARHAPSLISPVVVINGDEFEVIDAPVGRRIATGAPLMTVRARGAAPVSAPSDVVVGFERCVVIGLAHGVHARPAAALSRILRAHEATGRLTVGGRAADLRSVVALMALGLKPGDAVVVSIAGPRKVAAMDAVADLLTGNFEEMAPPPPPVVREGARPSRAGGLPGICAAPGLAVGRIFHDVLDEIEVAEVGGAPGVEDARLRAALAAAARDIEAEQAAGAMAEVLSAHLGLIEDAAILALAHAGVAAGQSAGHAWKGAIGRFVSEFESSGDGRLMERVADLRDVERRVLRQLSGATAGRACAPPEGAILVADDLLPSRLVDIPPGRLAGLCLVRGGATSHLAMMAAATGLPMLVSVGSGLLALAEGQVVILDADQGELRLNPGVEEQAQAMQQVARARVRTHEDRDAARAPALTRDGCRIEVFANLGAPTDVATAIASGAEGCGLLRTEFLFMNRTTPPSEAEQIRDYQAVLDGLGGLPLVIRTLDAGGDKPVAFLPDRREDNPALGMRGIRASLADPDLLQTQLRAILSLSPLSAVSVMAPMVTGPGELLAVRAALDAAARSLGVNRPALGLMIETPASVLIAPRLAQEADFFSIGTNDLSQYILAMDRTHPQLTAASDALHPAVLRAIAMTVAGTEGATCPVSVCGGLASDLEAIPLLIGLGVRRLSCTPTMVPRVKGLLRTLTLDQCVHLAGAALGLDDAATVRTRVRALTQTGNA